MRNYILSLLMLVMLFMPVVSTAQEPAPDFNPKNSPFVEFKVVFFTANWCAPCRLMKPTVQRLLKDGLPILESRVDLEPDFASHMKVYKIPTLLFLYEGKEVGRIEGVKSYDDVMKLYEELRRKYPPKPVPDNFPDTPIDLDEDESGLDFERIPEYRFIENGK